MAHEDHARKMGLNGRKAVLEFYNWESEGCRLVEEYQYSRQKRHLICAILWRKYP